jgi:hypothetical protein
MGPRADLRTVAKRRICYPTENRTPILRSVLNETLRDLDSLEISLWSEPKTVTVVLPEMSFRLRHHYEVISTFDRNPKRYTGDVVEDTEVSFRRVARPLQVRPTPQRRLKSVLICASTAVFKIRTTPYDVITWNLMRPGRRHIAMQTTRH